MPRNSKPVPTENPVTLRLRAGKEGRKRETERKRERKKERERKEGRYNLVAAYLC